MFDQKITLHHEPILQESGVFEFCLKLPMEMPSEIKSDDLKIQYLVVAAISFQNGCWGWIPALSREPIMCKQELHVSRVNLYPSVLQRIQSIQEGLKADHQDAVLVLNEDPEELDQTTLWSPCPALLLTTPLKSTIWTRIFPLGLSVHADCQVTALHWSLVEQVEKNFVFNITPLLKDDRNLSAEQKTIVQDKVVAAGTVYPLEQEYQLLQMDDASQEKDCLIQLEFPAKELFPDVQVVFLI